MAKSGLTFEPTKGSNFAHNNREHKIDYLVEGTFSCDKTEAEALSYLEELKAEAKKNYTARTGQKMQIDINDPKYLWSASVNLNKEHTIEDLQDLAKELEKKHGWQCVQCAVHFDEGHINERGIIEYNRHGHLEFFMVSKEGTTVFKKKDFRQKEMSELQTFVAEQLKMERGKIYKETGEYKKHLKPQAFKAQEREKEAVKSVELAKQEDLKAEIAQLRAELKEQGAVRTDYAELEQLNKELQAQLKTKALTEDKLQAELKRYRDNNAKLSTSNDFLQDEINAHKTLINDLQSKNEALGKENLTLKQKNDLKPFYDEKEINDQAESDILKLQAEHTKRQTTFDKREEKGFLGTKDVYEPREIIEIKEPKTFFAKVKDLAVKGSWYVQNQFKNLKDEIKALRERLKEAEKENALFKEVAEYSNQVSKRYFELAEKERTHGLNDDEQVQKIKCAKYLQTPFKERMSIRANEIKSMTYNEMIDDVEHRGMYGHQKSELLQLNDAMEQNVRELEKLQEKLLKNDYDKAHKRVEARWKEMSDDEKKYADNWAKKNAIARAMKKPVPEYDYKAPTRYKLNEIPKIEEEHKPKPRKPFVRE